MQPDTTYQPPIIQGIYTGLITQSGTNAPTITILQNTIGNIIWTRVNAGEYKGTLSNTFTPTKTWISAQNNIGANITIQPDNNQGNDDEIWLYTEDTGTLTDSILLKTPIEIKIYR